MSTFPKYLLSIILLISADIYGSSINFKRMAQIEARIFSLSPSLPDTLRLDIARGVETHCSPAFHKLAVSIMFIESSFRPKVTSSTSDFGLFQINSIHLGEDINPLSIDENIKIGCSLLEKHSKKFKEDSKWMARFHSKTPSLKKKYYRRIVKTLNKMKRILYV